MINPPTVMIDGPSASSCATRIATAATRKHAAMTTRMYMDRSIHHGERRRKRSRMLS